MAMIKLTNVNKTIGQVQALQNVNCTINQGEFFSLLGPSGCGKSTLLRTIAGLETPDSGQVYIDGRPMDGVPANRRPSNMVFQSYALFPHMSVAENVGYGLRAQRLGKTRSAEMVAEALQTVGLAGFDARTPQGLSGGQRQRVALARALIMKPKVLLLDEPLSALDKKLREEMQFELRQLQRQLGITFLLVTHDQEEALTMSDRVAVMFDGQITQVATPQDLYQHPNTRQVASFIGAMNIIAATASSQTENRVMVKLAGLGTVEIPADQAPPDRDLSNICAGIRPEQLTLLGPGEKARYQASDAAIISITFRGEVTYFDVKIAGLDRPVTLSTRSITTHNNLRVGDRVNIGWDSDAVILLHDC
ncbi:MAG: ABC transporter ATP-binding protein [Paracoccaceae bacterium]